MTNQELKEIQKKNMKNEVDIVSLNREETYQEFMNRFHIDDLLLEKAQDGKPLEAVIEMGIMNDEICYLLKEYLKTSNKYPDYFEIDGFCHKLGPIARNNLVTYLDKRIGIMDNNTFHFGLFPHERDLHFYFRKSTKEYGFKVIVR